MEHQYVRLPISLYEKICGGPRVGMAWMLQAQNKPEESQENRYESTA